MTLKYHSYVNKIVIRWDDGVIHACTSLYDADVQKSGPTIIEIATRFVIFYKPDKGSLCRGNKATEYGHKMKLNMERDVLQKYGGIKIEHPSLTAYVQHKFMVGSPDSVAQLNGESTRRRTHFT